MHERVIGSLQSIDGFISSTVWRSQANTEDIILINHYANEEAASEGISRLMTEGFFEMVAESFPEPLDLKRMEIVFADGLAPGDLSRDEFLSLSDRSTDPGKGPELETELRRIFGELKSIDGYTGSMIGRNEVLDEEVLGLVFWTDVSGFMASLPTKVLYEVRLFRRIL